MVNRRRGYTLIELLVTSAIVAFIVSLGASLFMKIDTFFRVSVAKIETQRDLRNLMDLMTREIRQAKSTSVVLSRYDSAQPPYSKITFQNSSGDTVSFWQREKIFSMSRNGQTSVLSKNVRSLMFSYPSTDNPELIMILYSTEKSAGAKGNYALQMGGETVRLLNQ